MTKEIDWIMRNLKRKRMIELPKWVTDERFEYVDGFLESWYRRKR